MPSTDQQGLKRKANDLEDNEDEDISSKQPAVDVWEAALKVQNESTKIGNGIESKIFVDGFFYRLNSWCSTI